MTPDQRSSPSLALGAYGPSLEAALQEGRLESVRRIAGSLQKVAAEHGLVGVEARARALAEAPEEDRARLAAELLGALREAESASGAPLEILLVEDSRVVAEIVGGVVAGPGRVVHVAATAADAERVLQERPVALVILDLILPDRDGRDLLIQIRESPEWGHLPVLVLSAMTGPAVKAECALLGANEFVLKPADPKILRAAVARQIERSRTSPHGPSSEPGRRPSVAQRTGPARVALVEDDRVTASIARHRLEREGFEVEVFADGQDALQAIPGGRFDILLLDVKVPGMDGFELLERFRDAPETRETPIMMLTAMGSEASVVRGLELGANDYMLKPFAPAELVARVRRQLDTGDR